MSTIEQKLNEFNNQDDFETFSTFARLHPVEAYDSNPKRFCEFVRTEVTNPTLTDEQIKSMIDESR